MEYSMFEMFGNLFVLNKFVNMPGLVSKTV